MACCPSCTMKKPLPSQTTSHDEADQADADAGALHVGLEGRAATAALAWVAPRRRIVVAATLTVEQAAELAVEVTPELVQIGRAVVAAAVGLQRLRPAQHAGQQGPGGLGHGTEAHRPGCSGSIGVEVGMHGHVIADGNGAPAGVWVVPGSAGVSDSPSVGVRPGGFKPPCCSRLRNPGAQRVQAGATQRADEHARQPRRRPGVPPSPAVRGAAGPSGRAC